MSDESSMKAYWGQLFDKRYWREVVIGLPPRDPWAPTAEMLAYVLNKAKPTKVDCPPASLDMVVIRNETYMEVADSQYARRGFGGLIFSLFELPIISFLAIPFYGFLKYEITLPLVLASLLIFLLFVPLSIWVGYQWKQDMLGYAYKPIRLVRSTRTVHVFQHAGPGGTWSLDWDKLVFCLKKSGLNWGVLGYLPDENGQATHAFYLGNVMPVHPSGMRADEPLLAHWEYFRRYMEEGPASVPAPDYLLPIENRREPFLYGVYRLWQMFGPFAVLFAPITTLAGLFRWVAMRMSRLPRWPAEVVAQCQVSPDDATAPPKKKATDNSVSVAMGVVLMLALDVVLFWLLFTRVFEIDRLFT
ncbi:DUF6708 domain-containing protein [Burkholderia cepacia]|uniref:DUF6708 domain-containing protein n=1 Tax=Burkholderia cepacia TaxID=292 RepID=UPI0009BE16DD|nr:hypothetical protein [Burkholderia cepacia]RQT81767.1 hypothetical protein DF023_21080 [Burkholderia cepacia]RQU01277.1 hypothetical protein DF022_20880 [Burkholderia cepacia]RQZ77940.1 hypothetical protein DF056_23265 [Burkholderia cepacia]RRA02834.1 hypothetical protein DF055_16930 [Burkholderia cepacia]RRA06033.1 hypothetical protein DF054_19740 [Burkholderia cepacia]